MKQIFGFLLMLTSPHLVLAVANTCTGSMEESGYGSWQAFLQCHPKTVIGGVFLVGTGLFFFMYLKRKKSNV